MPLFSCPICGWTTTSSLAQAVRAHDVAVPDCASTLEQIAYAGNRMRQSEPANVHGEPLNRDQSPALDNVNIS